MQELTFWTNVAVVVLGIQCFVVLIVFVVLNYVLVRLMNGLHGMAETYSHKLQKVTHTVNERTQQYSEKTIQPIVVAQKQTARAERTVRTFFGGGRTRKPSG